MGATMQKSSASGTQGGVSDGGRSRMPRNPEKKCGSCGQLLEWIVNGRRGRVENAPCSNPLCEPPNEPQTPIAPYATSRNGNQPDHDKPSSVAEPPYDSVCPYCGESLKPSLQQNQMYGQGQTYDQCPEPGCMKKAAAAGAAFRMTG